MVATMKRIIATLIPLLVVASASAQNVTIQTSGERLETLLPRIGEASGWKISADNFVKNEVLVLDVKDMDTRALLEKIASVTGLEWMQSNGGFVLSRSANANSTAWQAMHAWTTAGLKADIAKDEAVQSGVDNNANRGSGRQAGPERSAILNVIKNFPVELIANQDVGARLVFSNMPTRTQKAMPAVCANLATQGGQRILESWRTQISRLDQQNEGQRRFGQLLETRMRSGIAKHILVVQRISLDRFTFSLQYLDANGAVVSQGGHAVAVRMPAEPGQSPNWKPAKKDWDAPTLAALTLLSRDENIIAMGIEMLQSGAMFGGVELGAIGGEAGQVIESIITVAGAGLVEEETIDPSSILRNPAENEPLAVAAGFALRTQKPDGANLIAYLPDTLMRVLARGSLNGNLIDVIQDPNSRLVVENTENWVSIRPIVSLEAWNTRVDRAAFAKILAEIAGVEGRLSIASKANYAVTVPVWESTNSWDVKVAEAVVGRDAAADIRSCHTYEREGLAMWRAVNGKMGQQNSLTLPVANAFDRRWLEYTVFNSQIGPSRRAPNSGQGGQQQQRELIVQGQRGGREIERFQFSGMGQERTELLPNGLATTGNVTVARRNEQRIVLRSSKTGQRLVTSPQGYAWMLAQARNAVRQDRGFVDPGIFDQFGMSGQDTWTFTTVWQDGVTLVRTATGQSGSPRLGSYNALPANIRADIDREVQRATETILRRNQSGGNSGRDSRRTPPPQ